MDSRSLFSHHSSEVKFLKDRGSDRSQKPVQYLGKFLYTW